MKNNYFINYWIWFFKGSGGKRGFKRIINKWIYLHIVVGTILSFVVPVTLNMAANTVLLPLIGIFIGLSFAWAGNAQTLLQSKEIETLSGYHEGGFVEYVFVYQTAILTILITLICWAFAGLSIFDLYWPTICGIYKYYFIKILLFSLCSLTFRECWHVVLGAQWMLLMQKEIKSFEKEKLSDNNT